MLYTTWREQTTSLLGFGCGSVMGRVGRRDSLRAMEHAWDAGVTLFDTARSYGYGEAESLLGEFLQGKRAQAVVVTKFGIVPARLPRWKGWARPAVRGALRLAPGLRGRVRQGVSGQASPGHFDVATLRCSLETSLRELRTGYVDVLLAHEAPVSIMQREDLLSELEALVREGKVKRAGISSGPADVARFANGRPPVLPVLQYPAWSWTAQIAGPADTSLRLANHPSGGPRLAFQAGRAIEALAADPRTDPALRQKLRGDRDQVVAEFWFGRALRTSKPHAIVASMLKPSHLRANLAAVGRLRFSAEDLEAIEGCMNRLP
jgi:aryl-alcohol dehydrogenase-like predicted oxidoreductase